MFDPYHKWLGIPKEEQPPTYYRLLGISPREKDSEVIEEAAIRQMAHVRTYQSGAHAQECAKLLNEIAQARIVLLDPAKRRDYDTLHTESTKPPQATALPWPAPAETAPPVATLPAPLPFAEDSAIAFRPKKRKRRSRSWPAWTKPAAIGAGLFATTALVVWLVVGVMTAEPPGDKKESSSPLVAKGNVKLSAGTASAGERTSSATKATRSAPDGNAKTKVPPMDPPLTFTETGDEVRRFAGHKGWVRTVAISPNGRTVASGGDDRTIRIWDIAGSRELRRCEGHTADVRSVVFSPDGRQVLSGSSDKTVRIWDVETGREVERFDGHAEDSWEVACFTPDGQRIFAGTGDGTVRLWDVAKRSKVMRFDWQKESIWGVAYSPIAPLALTATSGKVLRLWDVNTGTEVRRFQGHQSWVRSVAFAPDGKQALSSGDDEVVRIWDVATGQQQGHFDGHRGWVFGVTFCPSGRRALSCGHDRTVRLFDVPTTTELHRFDGHTDAVWSVAVSRDGTLAASGSADGTVRLWRLPTDK